MIIDTHVHYWEPETKDRPHDPDGVHLGDALRAEQILADAAAAGVDRIVQITAALMGFDNRYSLESAAKYQDRIIGVFGRFDPLAPDVHSRLETFMAQKYMLGVRLTLHQAPYDSWLRDGLLNPFFAAAEKQSVPIQIFSPFLAKELKATARRYSGIEFLVDHMATRRMAGFPNRFVFWKDTLKLGEEQNIWLKVSYFPEAAPDGETYPFLTSIEKFRELFYHVGSARMIWGSNYPPVRRACTYPQTLSFIQSECDFLSNADKELILSKNFLSYLHRTGASIK